VEIFFRDSFATDQASYSRRSSHKCGEYHHADRARIRVTTSWK
jgi:hypothetical protein